MLLLHVVVRLPVNVVAFAEAPIEKKDDLLRHLSQIHAVSWPGEHDLRGLIERVASYCCQVRLSA